MSISTWHCADCGRDIVGERVSVPAVLHRLREQLTAEATPNPGQSRTYGRPHEHPRTRYFPKYSRTGERIPGVTVIRPDCPRPVKGRCECPPDGTWRPSVGAIRADATAQHATLARPERMPDGLPEHVWVANVYEQGPDGLWRCRWPVRRALEVLRGSSPRRFAIAVQLLRGEPVHTVWGSHGAPPDPTGEALRLLRQVERWADEERQIEWERRPRQWWEPPRKTRPKSQAQIAAEAARETVDTATSSATLASEIEAATGPRPISRLGAGPDQPSGTPGDRSLSGIPFPASPREEQRCA